MNKKGTKRVQFVTGTFQYYAKGIDPTMIVAVNEFVSEQVVTTQNTVKKCEILMDYAYTHPDTVIRYHASDICLHIDLDSAYLVQSRARMSLTPILDSTYSTSAYGAVCSYLEHR